MRLMSFHATWRSAASATDSAASGEAVRSMSKTVRGSDVQAIPSISTRSDSRDRYRMACHSGCPVRRCSRRALSPLT